MRSDNCFDCAKISAAPVDRNNDTGLFMGIIIVLALGLICSSALSSPIQLAPTPADLYDLDHYKAYTWGIDRAWSADEEIVSVTLSFTQIRNWDNHPNVLYIHLLDSASPGVRVFSDNQAESDYFNGQGTVLTVYRNLSATARDLAYTFTPEQTAILNSYAADGQFSLGFDPDCHFYNRGIALTLEARLVPIPEPATIAILVFSGTCLALGKKRKHALL